MLPQKDDTANACSRQKFAVGEHHVSAVVVVTVYVATRLRPTFARALAIDPVRLPFRCRRHVGIEQMSCIVPQVLLHAETLPLWNLRQSRSIGTHARRTRHL